MKKTILFLIAQMITLGAFLQLMPEKFVTFYDDIVMLPFDKRMKKIDQAIKKNPNEPWYYCMKSDFYEIIGDDAKILENYEKAIAVDSNFSAGHGSYARYLYSNDSTKLDVALMHIQKAIQIEPDGEFYYVDRGTIYLMLKKYDLAMQDARKVVSLTSNAFTPQGIQLIIEILQAQGKKEELKTFLNNMNHETFLQASMDFEFKIVLGDIYLEHGFKSKACDCYKAAEQDYLIMSEDGSIKTELKAKLETYP